MVNPHTPTTAESDTLKAAYDVYNDLQSQIATLLTERNTHAARLVEIDVALNALNVQLNAATKDCMVAVKAWSGK
jgi:chaperonin cofactor prefoldin